MFKRFFSENLVKSYLKILKLQIINIKVYLKQTVITIGT